MSLVNVEIVFPDRANIGIDIDWVKKIGPYEDLKLRKYSETMLFLCYMLRQIRNLGSDFPGDRCLLKCLEEIKDNEASFVKSIPITFPHHCISHYASELKISDEKFEEYSASFDVTEDIGINGKRFIGKFDWQFLSHDVLVPVFILETKGFSLGSKILGKDIPQLALDSILAFYAFLLRRYKSEKGFVKICRRYSKHVSETIILLIFQKITNNNFKKVLQ